MPLVWLCETIWRTLSVTERLTGSPAAMSESTLERLARPLVNEDLRVAGGNRISSGVCRGSGTRTAACETRGASAPRGALPREMRPRGA